MSAPLLSYEDTLRWILECTTHTRGKLQGRPIVEHLAADFVKFQETWMAVNTKEILLWIDIVLAAAQVVACDDDLDDLVDLVDNTLYLEGNDPRERALYFGDLAPSKFRRPVCGKQLDNMRVWPEKLRKSQSAALSALVPAVEAAVAAADKALERLRLAKSANQEFRAVGERKALVDTANALLKGTYGTLSRMPHDKPELKLPRDFAEQFFKRAPAKPAKQDEEPDTVAKLVQMIQEGEATIAELRQRLEAAVAREAVEEEARKTREANLAELERLQKEADERNAKIAALRGQLGMK